MGDDVGAMWPQAPNKNTANSRNGRFVMFNHHSIILDKLADCRPLRHVLE
jgi:hypothetical protein